jgi:hypothetical protein
MRQLTITAINRKLEKPVYYERIVCQCGHDHVYKCCPRCGMPRDESLGMERRASPIIVYSQWSMA